MSDTPITDENEVMFDFETALDPMGFLPGTKHVESWVVRQIERELTAAREALAEITHAGTVAWARRRAERALEGK